MEHHPEGGDSGGFGHRRRTGHQLVHVVSPFVEREAVGDAVSSSPTVAFLETVLNFYKKFFSQFDAFIFVCALGDFLALLASVLRQIARYLPHHSS